MISAKVTHGNAAAAMLATAQRLADERRMRKAVHKGVEPLRQRMRENIDAIRGKKGSRHSKPPRTGPVIIEDIPSEAGVVKVRVGLSGAKGGGAHIGSFLERGTSRAPAYPWCRPAEDAVGGDVAAKLISEEVLGIANGKAS